MRHTSHAHRALPGERGWHEHKDVDARHYHDGTGHIWFLRSAEETQMTTHEHTKPNGERFWHEHEDRPNAHSHYGPNLYHALPYGTSVHYPPGDPRGAPDLEARTLIERLVAAWYDDGMDAESVSSRGQTVADAEAYLRGKGGAE